MKFQVVHQPLILRTDYISEDGKIRLVKDDSACVSTRYAAAIQICGIAVVQFGATPQAAVADLKAEALRVASSLRDIAEKCDASTITMED